MANDKRFIERFVKYAEMLFKDVSDEYAEKGTRINGIRVPLGKKVFERAKRLSSEINSSSKKIQITFFEEEEHEISIKRK